MSKWIPINRVADLKMIPQIYNTVPPETASDHYKLVHTLDILNAAKSLGWKPKFASGVGDNPNGFHAIKLQHPDYVTGDGDFVQMIVMNSHDRTRRFTLQAGVYRLVCSNGLVIPITEFMNIQQKHIGFDSIQLLDELLQTMEALDQVAPKIREMEEIELDEDDREEFAYNALLTRIDEEKADTVDLYALLQAKRREDEGTSLWKTFNVVQEKVVTGDFLYEIVNKKGQLVERKGRAIDGFKTDLELNQNLFTLASQYI